VAGSSGRFNNRKTILNAAGIALVSVAISVLVLLFIPKNDPAVAQFRQAVNQAVLPFIRILNLPGQAVDSGLDRLQGYQSLKFENSQLKSELEQLRDVEARLIRQELLGERYRQLLSMPLDDDISFVGARVVADTSSAFARTVLADVGLSQGVLVGQAVMGARGFVGRVVTVGTQTSRILLSTDFNSHIPVVVGSKRARGILTGGNDNQPRLEFLPKNAGVEVNDTVLTSGDGGQIPAGLLVGFLDENGLVRLAQDPSELHVVRIVSARQPEPPEGVIGLPRDLQN